jgi:hypothetical protein
MSNFVYGVVADGVWYSNRSEFKMRGVENGIYSMDMDEDDFRGTLVPANIDDARKFFSKASKVKLIRGISFHDGIVPENPVSYDKVPIKVQDPNYDEFEEIEVALLKNKVCYFLQIVYGNKSYALMDVKEAFESKKTLDNIKDVTPEIRIVYTFHWIERRQEELRKELLEPQKAIRRIMAEGGAEVEFVKKNNRGFEVQWEAAGHTINTQLDKDYRVVEAGFCVSNWDGTQSARSLVNVLNDYVDNEHVYKTRTVRN